MANPQRENGSTDIANEILDVLCAFRVPGELRQILDAIIRKTYGWHKKEDFISNSQIMKMTGLLKGNVSRGLSKLITHKLVIKTDNKLQLNKNYEEWISFKKLSKPITKRKLSNKITGVIKVDNDVIKTDTKVIKSEGHKINYTKQTITKQNTTKLNINPNGFIERGLAESPPESLHTETTGTNYLIGLFKEVNPSYKRLYPQKGQREALERMVAEHGKDKVEQVIKSLSLVINKPYAPIITTPYELEKKLGALIAFLQKEHVAINKFSVTKV